MKAQGTNVWWYLRILWMRLRFAFQIETVYAGSIVGELISTLGYNLTFIVFLSVILKKFHTIAGYTLQDMLVFTFIGQVVYYTAQTFTYSSLDNFVKAVRDGTFDTLLLKPLSTIFQIMIMGVRPFTGIFFSSIPLAIYAALIVHYDAFHPTLFGVTFGLIGLFAGFFLMHFYKFSYGVTVLKNRQVKNLIKTMEFTNDFGSYPYEAYREPFRTIILLIAPLFPSAGIPALYFLNKTTSLIPLLTEMLLLAVSIALTLYNWRSSLKTYESVSS